MTDRPEPIPDVYQLCDLPVGTKFRFQAQNTVHAVVEVDRDDGAFVQVIEWPQRVYNGIPADDLDAVLSWVEVLYATVHPARQEVNRIREAIANQDQP